MIYSEFKRKLWDTLTSDVRTKHCDFWLIASKCLILGLLLFLSLFWNGFVYIALLFALIFAMTQTNGRAIYYILYLLPLISIFKNKVSDLYYLTYVIVGVCLVLGIKLFVEVFVKKTKKINWFFVASLILLSIYLVSRANYNNISILLSLMIGIVIIFIIYNFNEDLSFKEIALIFTLGVLTSIVIGFICFENSRLVGLIGKSWAFHKLRFRGVSGNVNVFACEMMLSLVAMLLLNLRNKFNLLIYPIYIIQLIALLFSLSKSAILMYVVGMLLYFIFKILYSAKSRKKLLSAIKTILVFVLISGGVFLAFNNQFKLCKLRFDFAVIKIELPSVNNTPSNNTNNNSNQNYKTEIDYSELTTGRTDIWKAYFKEIGKSPKSLLFGTGVGYEFDSGRENYNGSHNTLIQALYYVGIVGFALMLLTLISIIDLKKFKFKNYRWDAIILLLVTGIFLMGADFFSFRLSIYLSIILLAFRKTIASENSTEEVAVGNNRIPKTIHYIWLGGKSLPKMAQRCIDSWQQKCPDYEIKRWDESNIDVNINSYSSVAYKSGKYAFASDVLRYYILKQEGGIYLDIDVKLLKSLDGFLTNKAFSGFEDGKDLMVAPGLILGSEKDGKLVSRMLEIYNNEKVESIDDIISKETVCTKITQILKDEFGLEEKNITQNLNDVTIYATEYFCPYSTVTNQTRITANSHAIHLYLSSWYSLKKKMKLYVKKTLNYFTNGYFGILYTKIR